MLYFLDTNILVYAFDHSASSKREQALNLIREALIKGCGVISHQVIQEFLNVALRKFSKPMNSSEASSVLSSMLIPLYGVPASPALFYEGLRIAGRYRLSWYDSLIVAAALERKCDVLYSEDLQHGQIIEGLTIRNPFNSRKT